MSKKRYKYEEIFVRTVRNWRRACDECGLSSLQRSKFNYQLLYNISENVLSHLLQECDCSWIHKGNCLCSYNWD